MSFLSTLMQRLEERIKRRLRAQTAYLSEEQIEELTNMEAERVADFLLNLFERNDQ